MTHILAIETATDACSVALYRDGEVLERFEPGARRQTERVLPLVDDLLAEAGIGLGALDALAFGQGPGAFTGVRVATSVIQGLAFARDLPVAGVSTLAACALAAFLVVRFAGVFSGQGQGQAEGEGPEGEAGRRRGRRRLTARGPGAQDRATVGSWPRSS